MTTAFGTDWPASAYNNTRMPTFSYNSSGAGTVWYEGTTPVPACGYGPTTAWIGCSSNWGTTSWNVWLRDFGENPHSPTWGWYDTGSCSGTCFESRRVALHEIEHVALAVGSHDSQGEANTIMGSATPSYPNTGWNTHRIQRCDESAAQLLYDVGTSAGPYADCFDHTTNHGTYGLVTSATVAATSYGACTGYGVTVTGRLAIKTDSAYQALTNNPLTNRTLSFDRRPVGGSWTTDVTSTAATSASGDNWAKTFSSSSSVTYEFRGHFRGVGEGGEVGLDSSYTPIFKITWSSAC